MTDFDAVLKKTNGHLGVDQWNGPSTKFKKLAVKATAKPREKWTVAHTYENTSQWKNKAQKDAEKEDWQESEGHKTVTKVDFKHCPGLELGAEATNDTLKATGKGKLLDSNWKVLANAELEYKFLDSEGKFKFLTQTHSPVLMEKMKINTNLDMHMTHDQKKTFFVKQNIAWNDMWHLGWAFENKEGDWKKVFGHVVKQDGKNQLFARVDAMDQTIGFGKKHQYSTFVHSYEATLGYGEASGKAGFGGSPVSLGCGGEYTLSDKASCDITFLMGKHVFYKQKVAYKMSDKMSVNVLQQMDSKMKDKPEPAYKLGFGLDYTL